MQTTPVNPQPAARRGGHGLLKALLWFFGLAALAVLLFRSPLFGITSIQVIGLRTLTTADVVRAAGLNGYVNYFTVNENNVRNGVNSNRYLIYEGMVKHQFNGMTLYVTQREPCANIQSMGILYTLDDQGMILERSAGITPVNGLVTVTGVKLREMNVGAYVVCQQQEQFDAYKTVLGELEAQQYTKEIAELNVSNLDTLCLVTVDGFIAYLGDSSDMWAKIATLRAVVYTLRYNNYHGGVIELGKTGTATYRQSGI